MQRRKNKPQSKAQSFAEYALLIAITAGVLIAMRMYTIRAVQEKYRQAADVFGQGEQYEKGVTVVTNLDGPRTARLLPSPDPTSSCSFVVNQVAGLEKEIAEIRVIADSLDRSAADAEAPLLSLQAQVVSLTAEINQKEAQANNLRTQAATLTAEADDKQRQIDQYRNDYPACFGYYYDEWSGCPDDIAKTIAQLQTDTSNLRNQAASMRTEATRIDGEVRDLRRKLLPLNNTIAQTEEPMLNLNQTVNLRERVRDFRSQADDKQRQIDQYKNDYSQCFATP